MSDIDKLRGKVEALENAGLMGARDIAQAALVDITNILTRHEEILNGRLK